MNNVSLIHPVQIADPTVVFWLPGFVVLSFLNSLRYSNQVEVLHRSFACL